MSFGMNLKPKFGEKTKFCYMDTDSFIICIKTNFLFQASCKLFNRLGNSSFITLMKNKFYVIA